MHIMPERFHLRKLRLIVYLQVQNMNGAHTPRARGAAVYLADYNMIAVPIWVHVLLLSFTFYVWVEKLDLRIGVTHTTGDSKTYSLIRVSWKTRASVEARGYNLFVIVCRCYQLLLRLVVLNHLGFLR
jgi:hypothetical protein